MHFSCPCIYILHIIYRGSWFSWLNRWLAWLANNVYIFLSTLYVLTCVYHYQSCSCVILSHNFHPMFFRSGSMSRCRLNWFQCGLDHLCGRATLLFLFTNTVGFNLGIYCNHRYTLHRTRLETTHATHAIHIVCRETSTVLALEKGRDLLQVLVVVRDTKLRYGCCYLSCRWY